MKNEAEINLWLTLLFCTSTWAIRGPHHPRDSPIVKRHTHYTPTKLSEKITQNYRVLQDEEHLQEHMQEELPTVDVKNLHGEELELFYFLLHDKDKNGKLDGFELLQALMHTIHGDPAYAEYSGAAEIWTPYLDIWDSSNQKASPFQRFAEMVDKVLSEDDKNLDGYLDYAEYVQARADDRKKIEPAVQLT